MKKLIYSLFTTLMLITSGCKYDDTDIWNSVNGLEQRVATLEELCKQMNTNITSLQTIVNAIDNKDYITNVTPIYEGNIQVGYTIEFANSPSITIYHGKDGKDGLNGTNGTNGQNGADGYIPSIGIKQDADGHYYWTLDGDWLLDNNGNKVSAEGLPGQDGKDGVDGTNGSDGKDGQNGQDGKDGADGKDGVNGQDGITPQFKIENEKWYISLDGGQTWDYLGSATGSSGQNDNNGDFTFTNIDTSDPDFVIFTLSDGTQIKLPTWYAFNELKKLCTQMNTNIQSLQTIVEALQVGDYIVSCTPLMEGGVEIGYTITFSKSGSIIIYHGKNGANGSDGTNGQDGQNGSDGKDGVDGQEGHTPVIGAKRDIDGILYWIVDGEWLKDENGNKIPVTGTDGKEGTNGSNGQNGADGKDGITPQFKIENGYWYISYNEGETWTQLGKATGNNGADGKDGNDANSIFSSVRQDENYVYITLADSGEEIAIPKNKLFSITFDSEEFTVQPNSTYRLNYTIMGGDDKTQIKVYEKDGLKASVVKSSNTTGYIEVTTPAVLNHKVISELIVLVNDGNDRTLMRSLSFVKGVGLITNNTFSLNSPEDILNVTLSTNLGNYSVEIPVDAQSWISLMPTTESRSEMREDILSFKVAENKGNYYRQTIIEVKDSYSETLDKFLILQRGQYSMAVNVEKAGTLSNLITSSEKTRLVDLTITGTLNSTDYTFIRGMSNLSFLDLSGLNDTSMPSSTSSSSGCFYNSKISTILLPANLIEIPSYCFYNSSITSILIPESVTKIDTSAFERCKSLKGNLVIPNSVIETGTYSFKDCSFDGFLVLGTGLTTIGIDSFSGCKGFRGDLIIPDNVVTIRAGAFSYCSGFDGVLLLGSNVASIGGSAFVGESYTITSASNPHPHTAKLNFSKVLCKAKSLPSQTSAFGSTPESYPLYLGVPKGKKSLYINNFNWSLFPTIEEVDFDQIGY